MAGESWFRWSVMPMLVAIGMVVGLGVFLVEAGAYLGERKSDVVTLQEQVTALKKTSVDDAAKAATDMADLKRDLQARAVIAEQDRTEMNKTLKELSDAGIHRDDSQTFMLQELKELRK